MEFGLDQLRTGLRPDSSRFELSRHVEIARTCSNLVADRFEAKFHYAILVVDISEAGRRPASSCQLVKFQLAAGLRPASDLSATRIP